MSNTLLVKKDYLNELKDLAKDQYSMNDRGEDVKKIQEWLYLWQLNTNFETAIIEPDGIWGAKTDAVVKVIQKELGITPNGIITKDNYQKLIDPLRQAFSLEMYSKTTLRERLTFVGFRHLQYRACEIDQKNRGPWVRAYMNGHDGAEWFWCQGFICTLLDQAYSSFNLKFTDFHVNTVSTQQFREDAQACNLNFTYQDILDGKTKIESGDMVVVISSKGRAEHVFLITDLLDKKNMVIQTIEGNTNFGGSRNGTGVFMRIRKFNRQLELIKLNIPSSLKK